MSRAEAHSRTIGGEDSIRQPGSPMCGGVPPLPPGFVKYSKEEAYWQSIHSIGLRNLLGMNGLSVLYL